MTVSSKDLEEMASVSIRRAIYEDGDKLKHFIPGNHCKDKLIVLKNRKYPQHKDGATVNIHFIKGSDISYAELEELKEEYSTVTLLEILSAEEAFKLFDDLLKKEDGMEL